MQFPDTLPFSATIQTGDLILKATESEITISDQIDGRKETRTFESEAEVSRILSDFLIPEAPGKAFAEAFPFWC